MGNKRSGVKPASATSIQVSFTYKGQQCREFISGSPTKANLAATLKWRNEELIPAIKNKSFDYGSWFPDSKKRFQFQLGAGTKFGPYLERWNEEHITNSDLKDSTKVTNTRIVNNIIKSLGDKYIPEITESLVRDYLQSKKVSSKTIKNYLSIFRPALTDARYQGLIQANPLLDIKPIIGKKSKAKTEIDPFSYSERNAILKNASPQLHNIIKFAFWTGLRPSELIEVRWDDIRDNKIWISRIRTDLSKKPERPKSDAGYRTLKILPEVKKALESQKKYTGNLGEHIFFNPNTNKMWGCPQTYNKNWTKALAKAKVRYRYCYQARHTFATMMLGAGENLLWVSTQMGHESTKQTLDAYARWIPDDDINAGMKATEAYEFRPEI